MFVNVYSFNVPLTSLGTLNDTMATIMSCDEMIVKLSKSAKFHDDILGSSHMQRQVLTVCV